MELLDIHTHRLPEHPQQAIVNIEAGSLSLLQDEHYYSVGVHPWRIGPNAKEDWELLAETVSSPRVLAIGEAGLDRLIATDLATQELVFRKQVELAENVKKPLIIHAVRTLNELVQLKKLLKPLSAWVIHGFRGKKEAAQELINHGFYLSFGEKYNEEALKAIPIERLFLETDESNVPILALYQNAAQCLDVSVDELKERVQGNIGGVFKC